MDQQDDTSNNNNIIIPPSTPFSMAEQRKRRTQNRRTYGRRSSGVGLSSVGGGSTPSTRSTMSSKKSGRRRDSGLFSTASIRSATTALDFDNEIDLGDGNSGINGGFGNNFLDHSANARSQGNNNKPPRSGGDSSLDKKAHARLEHTPNSNASSSQMSNNRITNKKIRPNLPRPPRSRGSKAPGSSSTASSRFNTPKEAGLNTFEFGSEETLTSAYTAASMRSENNNCMLKSASTPSMKGIVVDGGGEAKRPRRSTPKRTQSTPNVAAMPNVPAVAGPPPRSVVEENVHPNDITETPVTLMNTNVPGTTRRSTRLEQKARMGNFSIRPTGLSSRMDNTNSNNDNNEEEESTTRTTRSRAKTASKKRSASTTNLSAGKLPANEEQEDEPQKLSPTKFLSLASFNAGSFSRSNSNSSTGNRNNSSSSASGSESFSSLARRNNKHWARSNSGATAASKKKNYHHKRSISISVAASSSFPSNGISDSKTPSKQSLPSSSHNRSISCGDISSFSYTSPDKRGTNKSSPSTASSRKRRSMDFSSPIDDDDFLCGSERTRSRKAPPPSFLLDHAINELAPTCLKSSPPSNKDPIQAHQSMNMLSPPIAVPTFGTTLNDDMMCLVDNEDDELDLNKDDGFRCRLSSDNDVSMSMSLNTSNDDDDNSSVSSSSSEEESEDETTPRPMTDVEVFENKSSYEDFKFLTKFLQTWSQRSHSTKASMGLNDGCLIAIPPDWTFQHRAQFAKWVATAFGFRVGNVGGAGGSFVKCSIAEGKSVLNRLLRILNDHKSGRLATTKTEEPSATNVDSKKKESLKKPQAKPPVNPNSSRRFRSASPKQEPILSIDGMVGDLLSDDMKGITLEDKKPEEINSSGGKSRRVPQLIRSMSLQPLASKVMSTLSPGGDNLSRISGRPPRLSSESAIAGTDFMNQLHGIGSPSPPLNRFPGRRFRERASRSLIPSRRPSMDKPSRTKSEGLLLSPHQQVDCLRQPFESPHPSNNLIVLDTPIARMDVGCMATPMPRQVENWGSRPILGKDWGESTKCCNETIDTCSTIFAKAWFTSDFYQNKEMSNEYHMNFGDVDESSLFPFYNNADANTPNDDDTEVASMNSDDSFEVEEFPTQPTTSRLKFHRCNSVGASALELLHLDDISKRPTEDNNSQGRQQLQRASKDKVYAERLAAAGDDISGLGTDRRKTMKLRKYRRMSLCVQAASDFLQPKLKKQPKKSKRSCYRLSESPTKKRTLLTGTPINSIMDSTAFTHVLSYLNEKELIHSASLVSTRFADVAAEALGNLMLVSVGCDPKARYDNDNSMESDSVNDIVESGHSSTVVKSMERTWPNLMMQFPWAQFLSDGAFKRVFKVWNDRLWDYEALSVMDVNAINDMGNLNLVGSELAVSTILSSAARRGICPNFVITRGVFTCQHEPPSSIWGGKDDEAPRGTAYNAHRQLLNSEPTPGECGNYQYIRMELCENGDVEEFIRNYPTKELPPSDCQNLLFQMAFALHVAGDRFGLKHYDVKLLNFLLKSAKDPNIPDDKHPHVVLRYGVGSHVFRLRMDPSMANVAKLADFGTSVMRTDTDGQPISLGQFTTLENTPADFLILGNAAVQGYGHDSFGLGLCMLHLFTGHAPYEELLHEVVCPDNLRAKLRRIWKHKSHDVIHSVMLDNDDNGVEIEDQTLCDTLYRYLVLFGIPEADKQFDIKKNGKVWRAINSTLLPPKASRSKACPDMDVFRRDRRKYSLAEGTNKRIANARNRLQQMDGAMDLLLSLVSFDPMTRATPLDVINSRFMANLIETNTAIYRDDDIVKSYTAYKI